MKIKVEVSLDWLTDDYAIDESVKQKIADSIVEKINESSIESITERAEKVLSDRADQIVNKAYDELLAKPIRITNQWGDEVKTYNSAKELIKERFDTFLTEKVDRDGRRSTYGTDFTRMDYIVKINLERLTKEFTEKAVTQVAEKIKTTLNDSLKEKLGERLINVMEIDKVLARQIKQ